MISQRESAPKQQPPKQQISPRPLVHSHHRLPRHVHLAHLLGPGLERHGLHLAQLLDLRAVLLVEQDDPSFNVVTASAKDKEIRDKEISSNFY